ncbi:cytolethal distending toxin subunit B family protein [Hahella sp. KA22]|uniref:cytolethal distending toxin subunit B family protein n=1 Tax=Hahella sp. KA22 TaxID=1628392 RepID=UPI000FDD0455|nr:cytolethal distending toxin subunit B family protein [Hahella sp. KA22]AZZ92247.1 cytolethal distending toxin subunit B family protein [Hahella sp. KA22]QAY55618.1 cytolethal distending toxin subunit B family protein [Hahella sp. KA22]
MPIQVYRWIFKQLSFWTLTLLVVPLSHAALFDRVAVTWNLQGSSHASESKWNVSIRQLVSGSDRAQVLAIQEAGSVPESAELMPQLTPPRLDNPHAVQVPVEEYRWNIGTRSRPDYRWIYFSRNDTGANRVNVAIVTEERANRVIILPPPASYASARPILGVEVGNAGDTYFSIHASANGGTDAALIVNAVHNYFATANNNAPFMIMGDWNRSPQALNTQLANNHPAVHANINLVNQGSATQRSGGNLDYAVTGSITGGANLMRALLGIASLVGQLSSDHTPVRFQRY